MCGSVISLLYKLLCRRVTVMTEVDDEIFTVCTVQETTKFIISGVRDPTTDKVISLEDAISGGVIDQERGLYWSVVIPLSFSCLVEIIF